MQTDTSLISLPETANQHDHRYHQLVFGFEGNTEFDIQGQGRKVSLGQGCLVPSTTGHAFCGVGNNRIVVINVPEALAETQQLFDKASYFTLDSQRTILLQAVAQEMQQAHAMLQNVCGQMLLCATHNLLSNRTHIRATQALNLDIIDQHIALNLHRKISVEELAALVFLSSSHFHHRFKQLTHVTPLHYITTKRIERAQALLKEGMPVANVAAATGFPNQSAFTHTFKQHVGITPARYRLSA